MELNGRLSHPARQAERNRRDSVSLITSRIAKAGQTMISKTTPKRSKIIIEREEEAKYWTRHFGVTKGELARAIETVGNSAAAVRKELSALKTPATT